MDKLTGIDIFVHAARIGSFVGAAQHLGLTSSAVSKAITRLEQRLNAQLFQRTTRALHLTEEGQLLFNSAGHAVEQLETAQSLILAAKKEPRGTLRVSVPVLFGATHIAPHLNAFNTQFPYVTVELHSTDEISNLVEDGFDVLIRTGELQDSNMVARELLSTRFMTCASPVYLDKFGTPNHPNDLSKHNCSRYMFPTTRRLFDWPFLIDDVHESIAVTGSNLFTNASAMINSVVEGGGIVHLQDYMLKPLIQQGKLIQILEQYACDGGPISAVYFRHSNLAPKIRAFVDFFVAHLRSAET